MAVLLVFLCLSVMVRAQSPYAQLDDWLHAHTKEMGGRSVLVIYSGGKVVYDHAVNDMTGKQKMVDRYIFKRMKQEGATEDYGFTTRQPIASCSKWLSAALVMTFVDEGKLRLTDTVGQFLPVLSAHGKGAITMGECLSHLTGIQEPPMKQILAEMKDVRSMDQAIALIADMPMEGEPGKVFHYSNAGLQIAGAVIEKISGKSFETLFAERIARPLGLTNTDFGKGPVALPAGGAGSTPEDYLTFLVMIMNKGELNGVRVLSEKSVEEMQVNRLGPDVRIAYSPVESGQLGYGYGEWVMDGAVTSPGLFGSFPIVDNKKKYCAFLLTFYLDNKGRNERYMDLKKLIDEKI